MTITSSTPNTEYISKWLESPTAVAPIIVASYSLNIINETIAHARELNKDNETLFLEADNGSFKIKDTRELINTIARTSFSKRRLIIINLAERLTIPAVNALLKSLEEPSVHNRWLLTTKQLPLILPTIRSRCQILRINRSKNISESSTADFWEELLPQKKLTNISDESLAGLHTFLTERMKKKGSNAHMYRALLRLRDYHKIKSHRGNTKLARDVLLASLYQLRNN